jgi:hypothetical protein
MLDVNVLANTNERIEILEMSFLRDVADTELWILNVIKVSEKNIK